MMLCSLFELTIQLIVLKFCTSKIITLLSIANLFYVLSDDLYPANLRGDPDVFLEAMFNMGTHLLTGRIY